MRRLGELDEAGEHLSRCLSIARSVRCEELISRSSSLLALAEVPRGNLSTADELSTGALARDFCNPAGQPPPSWQVRALLVQQWARYYQGAPISVSALEQCRDHPRIWSDPVLAGQFAALATLAALESGDREEAWRVLGRAQVDRRILATGIWSLPLLLVEGYLAAIRGDCRQTERVVDQLALLPGPAESALVGAVHLSQQGRTKEALAVIHPITSAELRSLAFTLPLALTLEAALYEELAMGAEADRSLNRALASTEPLHARRLFVLHGLDQQRTLLTRAAAAGPANRWIRQVLDYFDGFIEEQPATGSDQTVRVADLGLAPARATAPAPLTRREADVLGLVNNGASHAEVAAELYISLNTVKTHLRSIRRKFGVRRTSEAAAAARRAGWI